MWTQNEEEKLIELLEIHYKFVTEAVTPAKTKSMVEKRWEIIVNTINSLGEGPPFTVKQVKKKWSDRKSQSKKAVALWKKALNQTGNMPNNTPKPTEQQSRIGGFIGTASTEPIEGTMECDVAGQASSSNYCTVQPAAEINPITTDSDGRSYAILNNAVSLWSPQQPTTPAQTPASSPFVLKTKSGSKRQEQNEKMVELEGDIANSVSEIRNELKHCNELVRGCLIQMNRSNDIMAEFVQLFASFTNAYCNNTNQNL